MILRIFECVELLNQIQSWVIELDVFHNGFCFWGLLSPTIKSSFFYYLCLNGIQLIISLNIWALLYEEAASIRKKDDGGASDSLGEISHRPSSALSLISKAPAEQHCWKVETLEV